jgi:hypothetical protein
LSKLIALSLELAVTVILLIALVQVPSIHAATITLTSDPDCVSRGADRVDCFARGPDNALWHTGGKSGTWSEWESMGGNLTSGPSATSFGPNRLDIFAKGPDNALWHVWWDGSLHPWESLGGAITSDPDCTSLPTAQEIFCFARGTDKALWYTEFYGGTWTKWKSAGGVLASGPGVASWTDDVEVFVKGVDNAMWQLSMGPGGSLSQWQKRGGILTSDPDAVSWGPNRIDIVVRGPDNGIWYKWMNGVTWSNGCQGCAGYDNLEGKSSSGPTIASRDVNSLDVFTLGADDHLYHRGWNGAVWSAWNAIPMTMAPTGITTTTSQPTSVSGSSSTTTSTISNTSSATSPVATTVSFASTQTSLFTQSSSTQTPNPTGIGEVLGMLQPTDLLVIGGIVLVAAILVALVLRAHGKPTGPATDARSSEKGVVYCVHCGSQNATGNEFCGKCGAKVQG